MGLLRPFPQRNTHFHYDVTQYEYQFLRCSLYSYFFYINPHFKARRQVSGDGKAAWAAGAATCTVGIVLLATVANERKEFMHSEP